MQVTFRRSMEADEKGNVPAFTDYDYQVKLPDGKWLNMGMGHDYPRTELDAVKGQVVEQFTRGAKWQTVGKDQYVEEVMVAVSEQQLAEIQKTAAMTSNDVMEW